MPGAVSVGVKAQQPWVVREKCSCRCPKGGGEDERTMAVGGLVVEAGAAEGAEEKVETAGRAVMVATVVKEEGDVVMAVGTRLVAKAAAMGARVADNRQSAAFR